MTGWLAGSHPSRNLVASWVPPRRTLLEMKKRSKPPRGAWRLISRRCCSKCRADCTGFASQSTELSEPPTCPGWILCSRASLGQNCHLENNDLWYLPALLEVIRSVEGKPCREGAETQEGGSLQSLGCSPQKEGAAMEAC